VPHAAAAIAAEGMRVVLIAEAIVHKDNEGKPKLKNQNQNTEQRTVKSSFLNS
jgi:hypothetical protein